MEALVVEEQQMSDHGFVLASFGTDEVAQWYLVNDGVMGGQSRGEVRSEEAALVFSGVINTDGGGFASVRRRVQPGSLAGVTALRLQLIGDGRSYRLTFRTAARYRGRPISYQAAIPSITGDGEVTVPLNSLRSSLFGRVVSAPPFDPGSCEEVGILIADKRDGPFSVTLKEMRAVR